MPPLCKGNSPAIHTKSLPCVKEIPLPGEMSGTDKRVAVPAKEGAEHCEAEGLYKRRTISGGRRDPPLRFIIFVSAKSVGYGIYDVVHASLV